jgi:hypothetical protein
VTAIAQALGGSFEADANAASFSAEGMLALRRASKGGSSGVCARGADV